MLARYSQMLFIFCKLSIFTFFFYVCNLYLQICFIFAKVFGVYKYFLCLWKVFYIYRLHVKTRIVDPLTKKIYDFLFFQVN